MNKLYVFWRADYKERNRARYQRILSLVQRFEVILFVRKNAYVAPEIKKHLQRIYYCPFSLPYLYFDYLVFYTYSFIKVLFLPRQGGRKLFYATPDFSLILGFILKTMFKEKFVWVVDLYDNPMLFLWSRKFSIRYLMLKVFTFFLERIRILKKLDIAILVGKRDGKLFKLATESYGVPPKKIYCTTNGVDLEMFRPQTIGKRDAQFKLVFVGEVLRYHGLESWLNAVVYLKKMIPEIKLILIGYSNFNDLSWLNIAIKDQEIEGHVEFLGVLPSSQIPSFLAQADVCLCVFSKKLGLEDLHPIKLYEYLAMNKAVIASDVEGIRGIIKDGENGLLVPPDNPQALAKAAYHLYKNPIFKAELEKHARTSILEFDWKIVNRKILDEIKHRVCREGACQ